MQPLRCTLHRALHSVMLNYLCAVRVLTRSCILEKSANRCKQSPKLGSVIDISFLSKFFKENEDVYIYIAFDIGSVQVFCKLHH